MPGVFVLLWSTGFIGAKYGLPYAEPLTALIAFLMFDERLNLVQLMGMALTAYAVWLGSRHGH